MGIGALVKKAIKEAGLSYEAVSAALGISRRTLQNWIKDGAPGQLRHPDIVILAEITGKPISFFFPKKQHRRGAVSARGTAK